MEIYKVMAKGKKLPKELKNKSFYFEEKRTAEALIIFAQKYMTIKVKWECEVVQVQSHEQAFNDLLKL